MNTGIGFILHNDGFACSNNVNFDVERDIIEDGEEKISKATETLKYYAIFEGVGALSIGQNVMCLFKSESKKYAFNGKIRIMNGDLTVVDLITKSERIQEIISKIKQLGGK